MSEHPALTELDEFLCGALPPARAKAVVAHLVRGCPVCLAHLAPVAEWLLAGVMDSDDPPLDPEGPRAVAVDKGADYDAPLDRAFAAVRRHNLRLDREEGAATGNLAPLYPDLVNGTLGRRATWPLCLRLLDISFGARYENPGAMLRFARYAVDVAELLSARRYGARHLCDFRARAWAELGNAHRVNDDLHQADAALVQAEVYRAQGTGDEFVRARLLQLKASLRADQRFFSEAEDLLVEAQAIHESFGDQHNVGRAMIKRGIYAGYDDRLEEAIRLLEEGLATIDRDRDPKLARSGVDGLTRFLLDSGQCREARVLLWKNRQLFLSDESQVNCLKLRWREGEIAAGLGDLERAEAAFREVRQGFEGADLPYNAALATLDLAMVLLQRDESAEALRLTDEALAAFRTLNIARETCGALAILAHVAKLEHERGSATALMTFLEGAMMMLRKGQ